MLDRYPLDRYPLDYLPPLGGRHPAYPDRSIALEMPGVPDSTQSISIGIDTGYGVLLEDLGQPDPRNSYSEVYRGDIE